MTAKSYCCFILIPQTTSPHDEQEILLELKNKTKLKEYGSFNYLNYQLQAISSKVIGLVKARLETKFITKPSQPNVSKVHSYLPAFKFLTLADFRKSKRSSYINIKIFKRITLNQNATPRLALKILIP